MIVAMKRTLVLTLAVLAPLAAACSASTPNGEGRPPIFMPDPRSSMSGLTRTATRAA